MLVLSTKKPPRLVKSPGGHHGKVSSDDHHTTVPHHQSGVDRQHSGPPPRKAGPEVRGWFRPRPVVHVTQLSREQIADMVVASAWELTPEQWERLTDHERRECRRTVTTAPRFKVGA